MGASGYVVNLAAFSLLYAAGVRYVAASILSYFLSNALMYLGNWYFTFGLGHMGSGPRTSVTLASVWSSQR